VTITGTTFGGTQATSTVSFNGTSATPTNWSDTQIVVPVPSGATSGDLSVTVNGMVSSWSSFTVLVPPSVGAISPTSGPVGTSVTITGEAFGVTQGTSTVRFNGIAATPTSWSDTQIVVPVPSGATSGDIVVSVWGLVSNGIAFEVAPASYARAITIDHRQVANTDQTDFPVLISGTFPYLATAANGGHVQNASGYDIEFTSDAAGQNKLDHEIDSYDPATGKAAFWVRIPTLSHTTDTQIYIWYGNTAVVASQENLPGVWNHGYVGVYHLSNGTTLSAADSLNANSGTNHGAVATIGMFGGAGSFSGSSYILLPAAPFGNLPTSGSTTSYSLSFETWFKTASTGVILGQDNGTVPNNSPSIYAPAIYIDTAGHVRTSMFWHGSVSQQIQTPNTYNDNQWHSLTDTYNNGIEMLYLDGQISGTQSVSEVYDTLTHSYFLGTGETNSWPSTVGGWSYLNGKLDEVRLSTRASSADWIATEYHNQFSPSSFFYISLDEYSGTTPQPYSIIQPPTNMSYARAITIDHRQVANTDQTDFPVLISGTFPYLATAANGGHVQNASGYDIEFTSDSAGQNKLDHEIDSYNPATGTAAFWVRIPLLSHTTDTTVFMWYGNSAVVASQENKQGVWNSHYSGVWHFSDSVVLSTKDSTVNANNGTIDGSPAVISGQIGNAANFAGSNDNLAIRSIPLAGVAYTVSTWFSTPLPNTGSWNTLIRGVNNDHQVIVSENNWHLGAFSNHGTGFLDSGFAVNTLSNGWHYLVVAATGSTSTFYVDGIQVGTVPFKSAAEISYLGNYQGGGQQFGKTDEFRISTGVAHSADWITTEYHNQSSPSNFFYVSPAEYVGTTPIPYPIVQLPTSMSYVRAVTIDHRQVRNTDQTDFPVLISGTFPYLAVVANGGRVQSASGYDIEFTSDAAGQNKLDHEIDSYDAATGKAAFWVRIPTLSHTTDTSVYMRYGNSAVVASQENKPGVWKNGYAGVWHLTNNFVFSDSSPSGNACGTRINVTSVTGKVGTAGAFNGSNSAIDCARKDASLDAPTAFTLQAWVNPNSGNSTNIIVTKGTAAGTNGQYLLRMNGNNLVVGMYSNGWHYFVSNQSIPNGSWSKLDATWDGSTLHLFVNGILDSNTAAVASPVSPNTVDLNVGNVAGSSMFSGIVDEVRVVPQAARTADWIVAEYNNQSSPASFFFVSPTEYAGTTPQPYQLIQPPTSMSYVRAVTIDHRQVANTDQTDFPVMISGTFPYLTTVTNGGRVQNDNGYDVVFTSDVAGQNQLDHEIDSYNAATGQAAFWVRIPTLSHTVDTQIYMWYGNASVVASQENKPGVWKNGFGAVWHMGSPALDSTGNNANGTTNFVSTTSGGIIGGAGTFNGTSSDIIVPATLFGSYPTSGSTPNYSLSFGTWFKTTASGAILGQTSGFGPGGTVAGYIPAVYLDTAGHIRTTIFYHGVTSQIVTGADYRDNKWHYLMDTYINGTETLYIDGHASASQSATEVSYSSAYAYFMGTAYTSGYPSAPGGWSYFPGSLDEVRFSTSARTADWVNTEYNNQNAPGSFASTGDEGGASDPRISGMVPNAASAGTAITITGVNFGAAQNSGTVTFNGIMATPSSWSDTQIVVPVPSGATTGNVLVTANGVASVGYSFTVPVLINTVTPATGAAGTVVKIQGSGFGASQNVSSVVFNGTAATPSSWDDTQIVVAVPSGATTGSVIVTVNGILSNGAAFAVPVVINSATPTTGSAGTAVTLTGIGFGTTQNSSTVTFNGTVGTPTNWSDAQIAVPVPSGATTGNIVVTAGGAASNGAAFTVPVVIGNLSPTSGITSTPVTIAGTGFGATQGSSTITFNGIPATSTAWSDTQIVVPVPSGATSGTVVVTVAAMGSNGLTFNVGTGSYSYVRPIVLDHQQVVRTDQTDFPVLVTGIFPYLAAAANGGHVQNTNGYDIVFTSDAAGLNKLDHEIDSYDSVSGKAVFWVRIPLLSHTIDTTIYMWYGNGDLLVSLENKAGVWKNAYAGVWHFGNNSLSTSDSTSNLNNGINNGLAAAGEIGEGGSSNFNGSFRIPSSISLEPGTTVTLETWLNPNIYFQGDYQKIVALSTCAYSCPYVLSLNGASPLFTVNGAPGSGNSTLGMAISGGQWSHLAATLDGNNVIMYQNGMRTGSNAFTGTINYGSNPGTSNDLYLAAAMWGSIDEVRISTVARSGDWMATEYNNQSSVTAFVTICPEQSSVGQVTSCKQPPITSYTYVRSITIDHRQVVRTDQTDFPVLVSGIFPSLAGVVNGGRVQNVNGYDIVFTSDAAGQNRLDHEIDNYDPASGKAGFWVRIPLLSHTTDTMIYMWYGNGAVIASQENRAGVWKNGYAGVWHFGNRALSTSDSTANHNDALNNGLAATTGEIGEAGSSSFNGKFRILSSSSFEPGTAITLETWLNPHLYFAGVNYDFQYIASLSNNGFSSPYVMGLDEQFPVFSVNGSIVNGRPGPNTARGSALLTGQWVHLVGTFDGDNLIIYQNGLQAGSRALTGSINYGTGTSNDLYLSPNMWGVIDEARASTVARSADWIATEYNNQSIPDHFLYMCSEQTVTSSPAPCILDQMPALTITGVTPASGPVGTVVTITGTSFGPTQGDSALLLNGGALNVISWSDTQIVAVVPETATAGVLSMQVNVWQSNTDQNFVVTPSRLDIITPSVGGVGDVVTVKGLGFHSSQGTSTLKISGINAAILSWSNSSITATVPAGVTNGAVQVTVGGTSSNSLTFTLSGITIQNILPTSGEPGTAVTIRGNGFGSTQGANVVTLNNLPLTVVNWSDSQISATIPPGAVTGAVYISTDSAESNATIVFTVVPPAISSISPFYGSIGTLVTISGSGFGATQGSSSVLFNGAASQPTFWSDTQIVVPAPSNATSGPVVVNANGLTSSSKVFDVVPLPTSSTVAVLTNSRGAQTTYTSSNGTVVAVNGPGCSSCTGYEAVSREYDGNGRTSSTSNALGYQTSYQYDGSGNAAAITVQVDSTTSATTQYTYNSKSQVLTSTDPLGNVTTNTYDSNGNLASVTLPSQDASTAPSVTQFTYDSNGNLLQTTDPLGRITTMVYNSVGLVQSITDAQQNVTSYEYDIRGNRTAVVDPMKNRTVFAYDVGDRLTSITYPDGTSSSFGYDYRGRKISTTDQNGNTTSYAYDDADRLISVTDANGGATQYAYDTESNLTSITDANGHSASFTYGADNRVEQTSFPSGLAESYSYDTVGNLTSKTDRNGQTITYAYDGLRRLLQKQYSGSTALEYTYDLVGRVKQVNDPTGSYGFAYDKMGRLIGTSTSYAFLSGQTFSNAYTYDAASNRVGSTLADGSTNTYQYDTLGRMTSLTNSWAGNLSVDYDALGRRTQLSRPNNVSTNYQYDSLSRLLSVLHTGANDGASYGYDNSGNRTSKQNLLTGITENYSYDPVYQLTQVLQGASQTESYHYDPVGNRLSSRLSQYSYNNSNELTALASSIYAYNNNGSMTSKTSGTSVIGYTWDLENRLSSVTLPNNGGTVSFRYDPFGRRIQKASAGSVTNYVYDGPNIIAELNASGGVVASYTQGTGIDEPLAMRRGGYIGYYHADGLGSVTSLTNTNTQTVATYVYDSFGNTTATEGIFNPYRYTGREQDPETGLYYYRARYYDPSIGRFLSEDPIRFWGGIDFYKYVDNNPPNATDPSGKAVIHGYWCGPTWTGGLAEEYTPAHDKLYLKPKDGDALDEACMVHDKCYYDARKKEPCDQEKRRALMRKCNKDLLRAIPPSDWFGDGMLVYDGIGLGTAWPDAGTNEHCGCKDKGK